MAVARPNPKPEPRWPPLWISSPPPPDSRRSLRRATYPQLPTEARTPTPPLGTQPVSSPWYARSMISAGPPVCRPRRFSSLRPSGASWAWPGESEKVMAVRASAGNHMNLGGPAAARSADRLGTVFFSAPGPVGMHLHDGAVQRHRLEPDAHDLLALQMLERPGRAPRSSTTGSSGCRWCASCRTAPATRATCSHARRHKGWR